MEQILIHGARVFVYINGKKFGRCVSFSWNSVTQHREVEGIDSELPYELAPTRQRVQFNMSLLRTVADGGAEGAGMVPRGEQLPREKYFTIALVERKTQTVLFRADFAVIDSQQWQVAAKNLMQGTLSGKALTWNNEVLPKG